MQDLAEDMPSYGMPPASLQRRAHRRVGLTVAGSFLALTVLALGAFGGIRALVRAQAPTPANTGPSAPPALLSGPIAFSRGGDGNARPLGAEQVYLLAPDGSLTQLTRSPDGNNGPESWSPDGSELVVPRNLDDGTQDLFLIHLDGSPESRLTDDPEWDGFSQFSPDGSMIAFEKGDTLGIHVMNPDGTGVRQLVDRAGSGSSQAFSWSPDGTRIVFEQASGISTSGRATYDDDIYVVNVDGSGVTRLTEGDHSTCMHGVGGIWCDRYESPAWSPDDSKIAFVGITLRPRDKQRPEDIELFVMDSDGSGITQLTGSPGALTRCYSPAWSPDGSRIAVNCDAGVFSMKPDGTGVTRLAPQGWYGSSWSPDGTEVGLTKDHQFYLVNADGTGLARVADSSDREWGLPLWRP